MLPEHYHSFHETRAKMKSRILPLFSRFQTISQFCFTSKFNGLLANVKLHISIPWKVGPSFLRIFSYLKKCLLCYRSLFIKTQLECGSQSVWQNVYSMCMYKLHDFRPEPWKEKVWHQKPSNRFHP